MGGLRRRRRRGVLHARLLCRGSSGPAAPRPRQKENNLLKKSIFNQSTLLADRGLPRGPANPSVEVRLARLYRLASSQRRPPGEAIASHGRGGRVDGAEGDPGGAAPPTLCARGPRCHRDLGQLLRAFRKPFLVEFPSPPEPESSCESPFRLGISESPGMRFGSPSPSRGTL